MEMELYAEEQAARDGHFAVVAREPMDLELFDIFEEDAEYAGGYAGRSRGRAARSARRRRRSRRS